MMNKKAIYHRADDFTLLHGDCVQLMGEFDFKFDMIFADPPYFLSNGGISVQSGKVVCVNKGEWDKGGTPEHIDQFNEEWISACRNHLKENGTIWISGTYHNIFSVANKLTQLGFKILNVITWAKTNPPPNISCRYFTYSTEFIIWARKEKKVPHYYNYQLMKRLNEDKQMTDVWRLPSQDGRNRRANTLRRSRSPSLSASFWLPPNQEPGFSTHSPAAAPLASLPICWDVASWASTRKRSIWNLARLEERSWSQWRYSTIIGIASKI